MRKLICSLFVVSVLLVGQNMSPAGKSGASSASEIKCTNGTCTVPSGSNLLVGNAAPVLGDSNV
jgi:hypothetical protein